MQVTRYYRPPELLLYREGVNVAHYTFGVDVWSTACVLGECLVGEIFIKGHDAGDQMRRIQVICCVPVIKSAVLT